MALHLNYDISSSCIYSLTSFGFELQLFPGFPTRFWTHQASTIDCWLSQYLKFLSLCLSTSISVPCWFCFSGKLWPITIQPQPGRVCPSPWFWVSSLLIELLSWQLHNSGEKWPSKLCHTKALETDVSPPMWRSTVKEEEGNAQHRHHQEWTLRHQWGCHLTCPENECNTKEEPPDENLTHLVQLSDEKEKGLGS